jgi:hypothetical protein
MRNYIAAGFIHRGTCAKDIQKQGINVILLAIVN